MLAYLSSAWARLTFWFILSNSQCCRQKTALIILSLHFTCYMLTHPVHVAPKLLNLQLLVNSYFFHLPLFHEGQRLSTTRQQQTSPSHSSWVQTQSTWLLLSEPLLLGLTDCTAFWSSFLNFSCLYRQKKPQKTAKTVSELLRAVLVFCVVWQLSCKCLSIFHLSCLSISTFPRYISFAASATVYRNDILAPASITSYQIELYSAHLFTSYSSFQVYQCIHYVKASNMSSL